jgi:hypothetical protein
MQLHTTSNPLPNCTVIAGRRAPPISSDAANPHHKTPGTRPSNLPGTPTAHKELPSVANPLERDQLVNDFDKARAYSKKAYQSCMPQPRMLLHGRCRG